MKTKTCPYCNTECPITYIDIDAGWSQIEPCECSLCGAREITPEDDPASLDTEEVLTGWKAPTEDFTG